MRTLPTIIACTMLAACGGEGPDAALRTWVTTMEKAAEGKDRGAMLDRISEHYSDSRGNSRKDIGDTLLFYFLRQQTIAIVSSIDEITVSDGTVARITLTAGVAGSEAGRFGLSADAYRFDLDLEKTDDQWMLIAARWRGLGEDIY